MAIEKQLLGLAAEYAVAAELCRRGLYAQLTLGPRKRTDILLETDKSMLRIQVKAKQDATWPNCKGVHGPDIVLVFADFRLKTNTDRPDFYVLNPDEWEQLVRSELSAQISSGEVRLDQQNVPIWVNQLNKNGKPYSGYGIKPSQVAQHLEKWDKVVDLL